MTDTGTDWWRAAFADHYSEVYHHRDDASAAAEIAGLLPRLREAPGPILDACCGGGRHLAAMRAAGLDAYGFDFSAQLLKHASQRPLGSGRVARADMRAPPFAGGFGAITLLFTAFGYFDDAENTSSLQRLRNLLAPGGLLLLDLPDHEHVANNLVPVSTRFTPSGAEVRERRSISNGRVDKLVEVFRDGSEMGRWQESVRLYEPSEIAAMAKACDLRIRERWRGLHGNARDEARAVYWLEDFTAAREASNLSMPT